MNGITRPSSNSNYIKKIRMPGGKWRYFYTQEELDAYNRESKHKGTATTSHKERQKRLLEKEIEKRTTPADEKSKAYNDIAERVIKGEFGNGEERYKKLEEAGYDWKQVQNIVNEKLGSSVRREVVDKITSGISSQASTTSKAITNKPKKKKKPLRFMPKSQDRGKEWLDRRNRIFNR